MSTSFVAPDNPYQPGSPYWSSYNATTQANQANLLNPGSSPYGYYAAPTIGGVYQGADAKGNPITGPNYGKPGTFNATGYGEVGGVTPPAPSPAQVPRDTTVRGGGITPPQALPPSPGLSGNLPGYNPTGNPNEIVNRSAGLLSPPSTGPGGTPAGGSSWVDSSPGFNPGPSQPRPGGGSGWVPNTGGSGGGGGSPALPPVPPPSTFNPAPGFTGGVTPAGTPPGGGFAGPAGGIDPATGLPAGYFMSTSPGMANPVASPTFQTYMGQRLAAFAPTSITPEAFAADIVGQTGSYGSDTPYAQFARDYAGNHPDDPEIAARGGIDAFVAYYNQPQFNLANIRPDLAKMANGWGSGVAGAYTGLGDVGTKLLYNPGQQPAFDASPEQVRRALLLNGVNQNSPEFANAMNIANGNLGRANGAASTGAKPVFTTNPSQVTSLDQLVYSPGSSGPAGNPGVFSPSTPGMGGTPNNPTWTSSGAGTIPGYNSSSGTAPTLQQIAQMLFGAGPVSPDQQLALNSGNIGYLQQLVASGGMPTAVAPAWQAAVAAMKRNTDRQAADLGEQFSVSGNRFSKAFGTAATDFYNQSNLNQNALLTQMLQSSLENAAGRVSSGSQTLAGLGSAGLQQLSSQDFQAKMTTQAQQLQAALAMMGYGSNAAGQLSAQGASGAGQLNAGAITGAQGLFGMENQSLFQQLAAQMGLNTQSIDASKALSALWQSNLGLGSNLGGQQQTINQGALNNLYQEWMRQQPQYNPLLSMFQNGANAYPSLFNQGFQPSQLGAILGGLGGIAGAAPGIIGEILKLFNSGSNGGGSVSNGGIPLPGLPSWGDIFGSWGSGNGGFSGPPSFLNF